MMERRDSTATDGNPAQRLQEETMPGGALSGIRVLDLSEGIAGPFCAQLMSQFGADVTRVESPVGDWTRTIGPFPLDIPDRDRSGTHLLLNAGKQAVVLDPGSGEGRAQCVELLKTADVLLQDTQTSALAKLELGDAELNAINPNLIVTSVGPFGDSGPYKMLPATDLTLTAMSGLLLGTGELQREPLAGTLMRAGHVTGYMAYCGSLAALRSRRRIGKGQKVDVCGFEAMIANCEHVATIYSYNGTNWLRQGNRRTTVHPAGIYPCRDGYVQLYLLREDQWQRFCEVIARPELLGDEHFNRNRDRVAHADEVDEIISEWFARHDKLQIELLCQAHRVPVSMVANPDDLFHSAHLKARNYWVEVPDRSVGLSHLPGAPFKLPASPWRFRSPPPSNGVAEGSAISGTRRSPPLRRHHDRAAAAPARDGKPVDKPLSGVRMLDLSAAWAGPFCTRILGYLGAEIIKVESPSRPDLARGEKRPAGFHERYPEREHGARPWNRNLYFNSLNHNKRSVILDLATERGLQLARRLIAKCDGVIENFSARVMDKLGIGYDDLVKVNPDVIMLSMPGFGLSGPKRDYVAWGSTVEANSGLSNQIGYAGGRPYSSGMTFNDPFTGLVGAAAFFTALTYRDESSRGQHIDLSHQEAAIPLIGDVIVDYFMNGRLGGPVGNRHAAWAPQGVYRCSGADQWLALSVVTEDQWSALCRCTERDDWAVDAALASATGRHSRHDELDAGIGEWSSRLSRDSAWAALKAAGVPCGPAFNGEDLLRDPHLIARGFFKKLDHPDCGTRAYADLGLELSETPGSTDTVSPPFGADNDYVFKELLGLDENEVAALYRDNVSSLQPL